jgi:SOS-response transcriptional repressor LexA
VITYGEYFKKLRIDSDLTLTELAKNTGVSKSYLHDIENNKIVPSDKILNKLLNYYDLKKEDENELRRILAFAKTPDIVIEEMEILKKEIDKKNSIIEKLKKVENVEENISFIQDSDYREIPIYSYVRAGYNEIENYPEPEETIKIPLIGARADIVGVKVKGDSMEPKFHEGDIVLIKVGIMPENREIGVFIVENKTVIKVYNRDKTGRVILTSLNINHEPIIVDENTEFSIVGKFWKAIVS